MVGGGFGWRNCAMRMAERGEANGRETSWKEALERYKFFFWKLIFATWLVSASRSHRKSSRGSLDDCGASCRIWKSNGITLTLTAAPRPAPSPPTLASPHPTSLPLDWFRGVIDSGPKFLPNASGLWRFGVLALRVSFWRAAVDTTGIDARVA